MITTTSIVKVRRHVYLFGDIGFPDEMEEELVKWDTEWHYPSEEVIIHINSWGGSVDGLNSILQRIQKVGKLYTVVEGACASAALIIFLQGHYRAATQNSIFMAHNSILPSASRNSEVQINNLHDFTQCMSAQSKKMLTEALFKPKFINKRELEDIIKGNELYFNYESALARKIINFDFENIPQR